MSQLVTLYIDSKLTSVFCHMGNFGCGDGGWTPVMKINGNEVSHKSSLCSYFPRTITCDRKHGYFSWNEINWLFLTFVFRKSRSRLVVQHFAS